MTLNNEFVDIFAKENKTKQKQINKLLKKYKSKQDAVNEHIAAVIVDYLNDDGFIILSPDFEIAVKDAITYELADLPKEEQKFIADLLDDAYKSTAKETAKAIGIKGSYSLVRQEIIDAAINKVIDGKNFSDRVWANTNKLANRIYDDVIECVRTGKRPNHIISEIKRDFGSSAYEAKRLVNTELARVVNSAQLDIYQNSDVVDKIMWTATLEANTCDYCADLDGKIFDKWNVPDLPAHPSCRCCLVPVVDGWKPTQRADNSTKTNIDYLDYNTWNKTL